jgi:hypothetical protein
MERHGQSIALDGVGIRMGCEVIAGNGEGRVRRLARKFARGIQRMDDRQTEATFRPAVSRRAII